MNRLQWKPTAITTKPGEVNNQRYHARSSSFRIYVCEPHWARAMVEHLGMGEDDDLSATATRWKLIATWVTPIPGEAVPGEVVSEHATLNAAKRAANWARAERG